MISDSRIKELQDEFKCSRQVVKADIQIVAASIAAEAETLFSNDAKVRKAAQGKIIVKELPDIQPLRIMTLSFDG